MNAKHKTFHDKKPPEEGFTLIELLIVLTILSAFSLLIIPNFSTPFYSEKELSLNKLNALNRKVCEQSLSSKKSAAIYFDLDRKEIGFSLLSRGNSLSDDVSWEQLPSLRSLKIFGEWKTHGRFARIIKPDLTSQELSIKLQTQADGEIELFLDPIKLTWLEGKPFHVQ